jgi:hypothetical protein
VASNELRAHGRSGNLVLDNTDRTVLRVLPFARKEFQMDFGMRKLMELFCRAIREGSPDPIPPTEILRTARIVDDIFEQLPGASVPSDASVSSRARPPQIRA